jgi:hypothetical protein
MKKKMLAASAALLFALPGLSLAQEDHHHEGGGRPAGPAPQVHQPTPPPARPAPPQYHAPQGGQTNGQAFRSGQGYQPQGGAARGYPQQGAPQYAGQASGQSGYRPDYRGPSFPGGQGGYRAQPGQAGYQGGFAAGQGGYRGAPAQGGGRSFNGQAYRGGAPRAGGQAFGYGGRQYFRYRAAPYRFPGGYGGWDHHSWRRGEWLPQVFIDQAYFINDWYDFGLWQPDYGYEWIRVGADAVLINLADGQVVDVVPGVYYY